MSEGDIKWLPRTNKGWKCGICNFIAMYPDLGSALLEAVFPDYESAADQVLRHIEKEHPQRWETGDWNMSPIR